MAYNPAIPQATNQLSQSQGDILNNFSAINTFVNVNHVGFNTGDQGKHKWVTMPVQMASPPLTAFNPGEVGLYNFNNTNTGNNEMYINTQGGTQVPITASSQATDGWCYLPSGILLKWGQYNTPLLGNNIVTFPTGASIPVFNSIFSAQAVPVGNVSTYMSIITLNTTFITVRTSVAVGGLNVYYFVIGN